MSSSAKIHITGLPPAVSEEDIRSVFAKYGEIKIIYISEEKAPNASAFIVYSNFVDARNAIKEQNYSEFVKGSDKRTIKITYGDEETLTLIKDGVNRLLVEGFGDSVPEAAVYRSLSKYGEVLYCSTPLSAEQKPVGICLVTCKNKADADKIIQNANNSTIGGKKITIRYAPEQFKL